MELIKFSEISAHKIQTPGNHPKDRTKYSERGEILKSREKTLIENGSSIYKGSFVQRNFRTVTNVDVNVRQFLEFSECS